MAKNKVFVQAETDFVQQRSQPRPPWTTVMSTFPTCRWMIPARLLANIIHSTLDARLGYCKVVLSNLDI